MMMQGRTHNSIALAVFRLVRIADSSRTSLRVRICQARTSIPLLLDHFVGACEQRWWNCQSERLRGLEVNCKVVFCRRLHRQVGGLLTFEDAIDIIRGAQVWLDRIWPIRDQAAVADEVAIRVDGRQPILGGSSDDHIAMNRSSA